MQKLETPHERSLPVIKATPSNSKGEERCLRSRAAMVLTNKTQSVSGSGSQRFSQGPTGQIASKLPSLADNVKKVVLEDAKKAFNNRRRIQITGMPPGSNSEVK